MIILNHPCAIQKTYLQTNIDATHVGGFARYMTFYEMFKVDFTWFNRYFNHSCDPNMSIFLWRLNPVKDIFVCSNISAPPIPITLHEESFAHISHTLNRRHLTNYISIYNDTFSTDLTDVSNCCNVIEKCAKQTHILQLHYI